MPKIDEQPKVSPEVEEDAAAVAMILAMLTGKEPRNQTEADLLTLRDEVLRLRAAAEQPPMTDAQIMVEAVKRGLYVVTSSGLCLKPKDAPPLPGFVGPGVAAEQPAPQQGFKDALRRVVRLFGDKWPSVEVMVDGIPDRQVLPISDDDADHVRYARKLLAAAPSPPGAYKP